MKKCLVALLLMAATVSVRAQNATSDVTFNVSSLTGSNISLPYAWQESSDQVTVTIAKADDTDGSLSPSTVLALNSNHKITVSVAEGGKLNNISFTTNPASQNANATASNGSFSSGSWAADGDASSVTFTLTANFRLTKIVVEYIPASTPETYSLDSIPQGWTVKKGGIPVSTSAYDGGNTTMRYATIEEGAIVELIPSVGDIGRVKNVTLVDNSTPAGPAFDNVAGTIVWTVGNENSATVSEPILESISATSLSVGSGLSVSTRTYFETLMVDYKPQVSSAGNVESVMVEYRIETVGGVKFTPTAIEYAAVKVGTDNTTFTWSYTIDGVESSIATVSSTDLLRNNGNNSNTAQLMHSENITASECDVFTLRFYVSGCPNNKSVDIGNVTISGTVNGVASNN